MSEKTAEQRVVANRYLLQSVRGRGGMGTVWAAEDQLLERRVAVKEVPLRDRGSLGDEGTLRQRVLREARVAARVSHPNLVAIYDVVDGGDRVFLVQEYVDAPTLHDVVAADGALEPKVAAGIGQQVLSALDALHRAGVVHRDVKPSNVLVLPDCGVKVADFGIALVEDDGELTLAGSVLGSPGYLAPEQASGRRAEATADLWALGATLWFAVEGHGPYGDTPGIAALGEVVHGPVPVASRAGVLAPVLGAVLRKDPADRVSAAELATLLERAAADAPSLPPPVETQDAAVTAIVAPAAAPVALPSPAPAPPPQPPPPPPPSASEAEWLPSAPAPAGRPPSSTRPWLLGLVGVALLAVVVVAALALASGGDDEPTAASSATTATTAAGGASTTAARSPSPTARGRSSTTAAAATQAGAIPAGWQRYEDDDAGYALAHPAGWQVRKRDGNRVDFADPATGAYLRVDWGDEPKDPLAAWQDQSRAFGSSRAGYEQLRLEETTYKGFPGALWEYRYSEGQARLHASNLTFVASEKRAYALNFQTSDGRWEADQPLRRQLEDSFTVLPPDDDGKKKD